MVQLYVTNTPEAIETLCRLGYERAKGDELMRNEKYLNKRNASHIRFLTITKRWKFTNRQPHPYQIATIEQIYMLELIESQAAQSELMHSMRNRNAN